MRKLKLELDSLQVESFRPSNEAPWRGTVDARSGLEDDADTVFQGEVDENTIAITPPPPNTLPPAKSCDTCYITCVTRCSCATQPCDTCT